MNNNKLLLKSNDCKFNNNYTYGGYKCVMMEKGIKVNVTFLFYDIYCPFDYNKKKCFFDIYYLNGYYISLNKGNKGNLIVGIYSKIKNKLKDWENHILFIQTNYLIDNYYLIYNENLIYKGHFYISTNYEELITINLNMNTSQSLFLVTFLEYYPSKFLSITFSYEENIFHNKKL